VRPGEVLDGRFEIEQRVGAGGVGEVYRARDRATGEAVAIKALFHHHEEGDARFGREARFLAELHHPGIVRYVTHGMTSSGEPYLAMEWLEGEDLSHRLSQGRLTVDETVVLGTRAAEAMGTMHARGVVHRDVKPSNLFLVRGRAEGVKLLDFGLARLDDVARVTQTGVVVGTLGYMAPEQARGGREIDARADVFSLGCVLFKCLTGVSAFTGGNIMALLAKILLEEPPRVRELRAEVPAELDALIARMMDKDPGSRPRDGAEVAAALVSLASGEGSSKRSVVAASSSSRRRSFTMALRGNERRLVSVVLVGRSTDAPLADTLTEAQPAVGLAALRKVAEVRGGQATLLADGSIAVTYHGSQVATDQAAQAARIALAIHALVPDRPLALATGRSEISGRLPLGEAIDRATRLLADVTGAPAGVAIDEVTSRLLGPRFVVSTGQGLFLLGEDRGGVPLLGKVTACVGRERELRRLQAIFAECVEEPMAQAVLVTAKAGVGKSRLVAELLRLLQGRPDPPVVWRAQGDPLRVAPAFALLGEALRGAAGIHEGEPIEARRDKLVGRVAQSVPAAEQLRVAALLGELVGVPFPADDSPLLRAARQDAQLMSVQIGRAFEDFVRAECSLHPVLLVLDDLHWGDGPTMQLVDATLRRLKEAPWMVLALARPEVVDLFPRLWTERKVQVIQLDELTRKAGARLAHEVLGDAVGEDTVERILTLSGGNAFYLEELIRAVAQGRHKEELPETLVAMVEARLEGLDPMARRVLRAASVFGEVFWEAGVAALLGEELGRSEIAECLEKLVDQELLRRRADEGAAAGEPDLAFRHALMREGAYAMLTDEDQVLGHRLAAEWLEQQGAVDGAPGAGAPASLLASHYQVAGVHDKAFDYFLDEANLAARLFAVTDARHLYAEALGELSLLPDDEAQRRRRIDATTQLVSISWFASAPRQTVAQMEQLDGLLESIPGARREPDDAVRAARIALWAGRACHAGGKLKAALAWYDKGLERSRSASQPQLTATISSSAGQALCLQGRVAEARPRLEQAIDALADAAAWADWARVHGYLGMTVAAMGDISEGLRLVAIGETRAEELKSSMHMAVHHLYRCGIALYQEDWQTMCEQGAQVVDIATRAGDLVVAYMGHRFVEWGSRWLGGDPAEIDQAHAAAVDLYARVQGSSIDDWFLVADIDALFLSDRLDEAASSAESAAAHCHESGCVIGEALAHRSWGRVDSAEGRHRRALERFAESTRISELAALRVVTTRTRKAWADACRRTGDEGGLPPRG
jgi:tetratricopeptide (TPR) repeat protein